MSLSKNLRKILFSSLAVILSLTACSSISTNSTHASHITPRQRINRQIKHMSLKDKIGQMFVVGLPNNNRSADYAVHHYHLGGVIMNGDNFVGNSNTFKKHTADMQKASHHTLLIGTDQGGGEVSRLNLDSAIGHHAPYPSPQTEYKRHGMKGVKAEYSNEAWHMRKLGMNWNYAPDADVADKNTSIYPRTFGRGYQATARYIRDVVPVIQAEHVGATLKHFPGYGDVSDTDYHVATTNRSKKVIKRELIPFKAGIRAKADSVMVTNIILNKINRGVPATLSKKDINLLRHQLHFKGVIVTDTLNAVAIQNYCRYHSHGASADYLAVKAGNDMIMNDDYKVGIPRLVHDVKTGSLSKHQINNSVRRILMMKHKLGLNY